MKRKTLLESTVLAVALAALVAAGLHGWRVPSNGAPRARIFVALAQHRTGTEAHRMPFPENSARGEVMSPWLPEDDLRLAVALLDAPQAGSWLRKSIRREIPGLILAGVPFNGGDERVLALPALDKLQAALAEPVSPLDETLPGWRDVVAGALRANGCADDRLLLRLVEFARVFRPDAHVLLRLNAPAPTEELDSELIGTMNRFAEEGGTCLLVVGGRPPPAEEATSFPAPPDIFLAWGAMINPAAGHLSAHPADLTTTLSYLADVPIYRDQEGAVLIPLLADGLIFRRPEKRIERREP